MTRRRSFVRRLAPIVLAMALVSPASAEAAAPVLVLEDGSMAALSLENAAPGASASACLRLAYGGDGGTVRLYGKTDGTGFDRYLDLVVTRGPTCSRGRKIYDGTLAGFPDGPEDAIRETWSEGESHVYRFAIRVRDDNDAQGLMARQTFTWSTKAPAAAAPAASPNDPKALVRPPDAEGIRELLGKIARVAAEAAKRTAFPSALLFFVVGFLAVQSRIDARDPKLALAPVYPSPDLPFEPPDREEQ